MTLNRDFFVGLAIVIGLVILRANLYRLPLIALYLLGFSLAGFLLYAGWKHRGGTIDFGAPQKQRVQYWRGQRIVLEDEPRRSRRPAFSWALLIPGLYLFLGGTAILLLIRAAVDQF